MRRLLLLAVLTPLLLAPSCPQRQFEVVMEPLPDDRVRRSITVWTIQTWVPSTESEGDSAATTRPVRERFDDTPEEVLKVLRTIYGPEQLLPDKKHRFAKSFGAKLPVDIKYEELSNFGRYAMQRSRMGTSAIYVERMPGQLRMVDVARAGQRFVDTLIRAFVAYAEQHEDLKHDPEKLAALKDFLEGDFRDDILNGMLLAWLEFSRSEEIDDDLERRLKLRLGAYLVERGYLDAGQMGASSESFADTGLHGVLRKIASVLGHSPADPLPPVLAALEDPENLDKALESGLASIGVTEEEFDALLEPANFVIIGDAPSGVVKWKGRAEPVDSNGEWNAETRALSWDATTRGGLFLPQILFATWAEPDEAFQKKHFGAVVLREQLAEYAAWRNRLSAPQRAEWDRFVDSLSPGSELRQEISEFRFRRDPAEVGGQSDETPYGAQVLSEALQEHSPPKPR